MIFFAALFLVILCFSYYGFSSYFFPSKKIIQHQSLKEFQSNVVDIIFDQSFSNYSDSFNIRQIKNLVLNDGPSTMMIAPVEGYSTEGIDLDKNHHGVDIVSKKGDLINITGSGIPFIDRNEGHIISDLRFDYGNSNLCNIIMFKNDYSFGQP